MDYQSIGYTKKTYGVQGEVKLKIEDDYLESLAQAEVLFLAIDGRKIPHFIEYINFDPPFVIKFEEYDTRESALDLTGREIFLRLSDLCEIQAPMEPSAATSFQSLTGYTIVDRSSGWKGRIKRVVEYPQQVMGIVEDQEKEILIPLIDQLIVAIQEGQKEILMDLPEGILDLG